MDVRTICLGILTRGDATGYEIKKLFEDDGYQHFVEASFGSIYPALNRLTEEGYVSVREESPGKAPRPQGLFHHAGRPHAFIASLLEAAAGRPAPLALRVRDAFSPICCRKAASAECSMPISARSTRSWRI